MPHSFGWFALLLLFSEDRSVQANKCLPRVNTYFNYICYEAVQVCLVPTCRLWAVPRSEHDPGDNRELLQVAAPLPSVLAVCCSAFPVQTIQSCVFTSELACCWCHPPRGALGRAVGAASGLQALPCPWKIASKRRQERRASLSTIICRALFLCL